MQYPAATPGSEGGEPSLSFTALPLDARLLTALEQIGFTEPTPIQWQAIGPLLEGKDVIGRARTGSGKTAAFGLPLLHRILTGPRDGGVKALVLTPTRELALQVSAALRTFVVGTGMPILTVYGGASYTPQLRGLREGTPVVVGTPGRLIDLLDRGALDLSGLQTLVLDEADEMLRMGFQEDVERIISATPDGRQMALFSATMPPPIRRIAERTGRDPVEIQVERDALTVDHIQQKFMFVPPRHRLEALVRILGAEPKGSTLVFARTRAGCAELADALVGHGIAADALHGDLDQSARERVLQRLRSRRLEVVVATDIAARGIDVPHLALVINMELPRSAESYVHRIGRTGRAGGQGKAITLVGPGDRGRLSGLEHRIKARLLEQPVPSDADMAIKRSSALQEALFGGRTEGGTPEARALSERLSSALGWTPEEVGEAALELLAAQHGIKLSQTPDTRPPHWARRPEPRTRALRPVRNGQKNGQGRPNGFGRANGDSKANGDRNGDRKANGDRNGDRKANGHVRTKPAARAAVNGAHKTGADGVELFLSIGKSRGVRAADLVGALTAEGGVTGRDLGRVTIGAHKSFVAVSEGVATRILSASKGITIRGVDVRIARAFPRGPVHPGN